MSMEWQPELLKLAGSAVVGFFAGRFQTTYNDRLARNKDLQTELLKAIRACSVSAIDYHTFSITKEQLAAKAFHLKNQLWRIRSDLILIEKGCSVEKGSLIALYVAYFDATTQYPFEPVELPDIADYGRLAQISTTGEALAADLASARHRFF